MSAALGRSLSRDADPDETDLLQAIRNTPSVILHESVDDGDYSESDFSRADTPAFDSRVASPPPPPRVVAEARQLPICECRSQDRPSERPADGRFCRDLDRGG